MGIEMNRDSVRSEADAGVWEAAAGLIFWTRRRRDSVVLKKRAVLEKMRILANDLPRDPLCDFLACLKEFPFCRSEFPVVVQRISV